MNSEVLIVGGGIIGLAIARGLQLSGIKEITILERGEIGRESSYAAAGMLAPYAETDEKTDFTEFCAKSLNLYPNFAEELNAETGVDIELDCNGSLYLAFTEADSKEIGRRYEWQKRAGLSVEHLTARETLRAEPFVSPDVRESLFFPNDWQVENRRLLFALEKYTELNHIKIIENAEIVNLLIENNRIIGAETETVKFHAATVVIATGAWTSLIKAESFVLPQVKPIRGQMISYQTAKRLFGKVIYSPRGYIVPRTDGRILVGATVEDAGFDKSITDAGTELLRETALEMSPGLGNLEIAEKWVGLRPFAADGLPILGAFPEVENLFVATAHYRNGILLAPLTAKVIVEKIAKNLDSEYLKIFSPQRFRAASAKKF
ncbi:MAG: glycine oxidase ThiO [Acidobacteriota bacterium]|nr:glycine oxidase ThiO [Acidobacteriota bacterium]